MTKKKWNIAPPCEAQARQLQQELEIPQLPARVLAARGMTEKTAEEFLKNDHSHFHDPFLMADMRHAVALIEQSIAMHEKIAIYGDYDVDGVTATCVLIQYLRSRGVDCEYYIPDRINEGYGLNLNAITRLYENGCRLMITVDSGITAVEEALFAKEIGLKLIITDHHECKEALPKALAVVNPRRPDSAYPFRELAGVGVAFKLICALEHERPLAELIDEYADIVAVGTVADVMPLTKENRFIVAEGLKRLQNTKNPGMKMLMQKLGIDQKPLTSNAVSFTMAPRINAAGRLGDAFQAVELFLTQDFDKAAELAEYLCELNRMRQEAENKIYEEILKRLEGEFDPLEDRSIVMWGEHWHNGVIGIVSSRLADRYGVPVILISLEGDCGKGSGRSIKGFNLYGALEENSSFLEKFGGHELAVGLTIHRDKLEEFRRSFAKTAHRMMMKKCVEPMIAIDCEVSPSQLQLEEVRSLSVLEPFGMGNPQPVFCMYDLEIEEITPISRDRHTKMQLLKNGSSFYAFMFGMGISNCPFICGDTVDAVFSAEINHYRGRESVQLILKDIRWNGQEDAQDARYEELYQAFRQGEEVTPDQAKLLCPSREELVAVFRHVKTRAAMGKLSCRPRTLYRQIRYEAAKQMNMAKLQVCLDVFAEFDIFSFETREEELEIYDLNRKGKADINGSKILKRLFAALSA